MLGTEAGRGAVWRVDQPRLIPPQSNITSSWKRDNVYGFDTIPDPANSSLLKLQRKRRLGRGEGNLRAQQDKVGWGSVVPAGFQIKNKRSAVQSHSSNGYFIENQKSFDLQ